MSALSKLNIKSVSRVVYKDPAQQRRAKLLAGIEEQMRVQEAAVGGREYTVKSKRWVKSDAGERTRVDYEKRVRPWYFEQDGGWYVQCKYGARSLLIADKGNAVFVKELKDVAAVLEAFYAAAAAGEFDAAVLEVAKRKA